MVRVAVLLRAHPATSFNQLAEQLAAKQQALALAASTSADPSELLEQLYWLARMAAHVLADTGVGEVPLPPEAVLLAVGDGSLTTPAAAAAQQQPQQQQQQQQAAAGAAAIERLSRALLELTALCLQQAAAAVVSSRLMEGAVWGAARWGDTYLFPEDAEPLPEPLEAAFGDQAGAHILDMLLHVAQHCLAAFPGEAQLHRQVRTAGMLLLVGALLVLPATSSFGCRVELLHRLHVCSGCAFCAAAYACSSCNSAETAAKLAQLSRADACLSVPCAARAAVQVCHTLLPTLVHRKPLCRRVVAMPSWQALAAAFARRDAALTTQLSQKFQRALCRSLCLAASGFAEDGQAQQYVSHLLLQTVNDVAALAQQQQLTAMAQRADVQLQVRGAAGTHRSVAVSCKLVQAVQSVQFSDSSFLLFLFAAGHAERSTLCCSCHNQASCAGFPGSSTALLLLCMHLQVCCMVEVLRGAAAGTLPSTCPALLNLFSGLLGPMLTLHSAFKHVAPVVALLLKLADDIVENLGVYIEAPQQREQLLNWTLQLLMQYRDSNLWQVWCRQGCSRQQCKTLRQLCQPCGFCYVTCGA
jgi:hypothetical protein